MFGNKSLPSRIYSYGGKAPTHGLDTVNEQMSRAHRYRNALVHLEHLRRDKVNRAVTAISPELTEVEAKIAKAETDLEAAREEINKARVVARGKVRPKELVEKVKGFSKLLKELRPLRRELRKKTFESGAWKAEQERINLWNGKFHKRLRAASWLYWGTYLHIEGTVDHSGPPPKYQRWDGGGHLAVQIQHGLLPAEAFAGEDNRLRIDPVPAEAWLPGGRKLRKTNVHFRVNSDDNSAPVWAVIRIVLHRPLPEDARIKWVHLIRYRIATKCEWRVQFVLARESGWEKPDLAKTGTVGVDVGWRVRDDGSLRVAYWVGDDGKENELALSPDWMSEMKKTRDIQSIRKDNFNKILKDLVEWSKGAQTPDWWKETTKAIGQWKAEARLASLVLRWRDNRFSGDEKMFEAVETWRKRDRHLYEYEGNLRDQLQSWRENHYRNFAAGLRRTYRTAVVEALDLRDFHVLPEAEETPENELVRQNTRNACLSILFRCIKESMAEMVKVPAEYTTMKCHKCGHIEDFDRLILARVCPKCSDKEDQDRVAAINLLHFAVPPKAEAPVV